MRGVRIVSGQNVLVVDDICDGGANFLNLYDRSLRRGS